MMRKILFGFIWFGVIFVASYLIGGVIYVALTGTPTNGGFQAGRAAGMAFRQVCGAYFLVGALLLAIIGTTAEILPGTKKKPHKQ